MRIYIYHYYYYYFYFSTKNIIKSFEVKVKQIQLLLNMLLYLTKRRFFYS